MTNPPDGFRYRACGISLRSDRPLPALRELPEDLPVDLVMRKAQSALAASTPSGARVIIDGANEARESLRLEHDSTGYRVRISSTMTAVISTELTSVDYELEASADEHRLGEVLSGPILALVAALGGCTTVLRASAVQVGERALVVVGHSGMGKSTLAAACCAAGAGLIAEDVVGIDGEVQPCCFAGATTLRLRARTRRMVEQVPAAGESRFESVGELGVRPVLSSVGKVPIGAVVVPKPSRRADTMSLRRLPPVDALFRLMNFPRISGLNEAHVVRQHFQTSGRIARSVPVYEVTVPWRPLPSDVGEQLNGLVRDDKG